MRITYSTGLLNELYGQLSSHNRVRRTNGNHISSLSDSEKRREFRELIVSVINNLTVMAIVMYWWFNTTTDKVGSFVFHNSES